MYRGNVHKCSSTKVARTGTVGESVTRCSGHVNAFPAHTLAQRDAMTSAAGAVAHRYFHTALCEATACRASALTNRIPRAAFGVSVLDGGAVRFHMEIKNASMCAFASSCFCFFFPSLLSLYLTLAHFSGSRVCLGSLTFIVPV